MNENNLVQSFPVSLNETVMFFLKKGFKPDKYGYLQKRDNYVKIVENGISLVNKNRLWDSKGDAIDKDTVLLHIAD